MRYKHGLDTALLQWKTWWRLDAYIIHVRNVDKDVGTVLDALSAAAVGSRWQPRYRIVWGEGQWIKFVITVYA